MSQPRVIVIDVIGLQPEHVTAEIAPNLAAILTEATALQPPFPALTVPAQTTLATGQSPGEHGDISSGEYDRQTDEAAFWERDSADRQRLWETAQAAGTTTGALFFQHLIGTDADVAITPSPIEDEDNNLLEMNCWTNPEDLYDTLQAAYGHFPLHRYWGPGADEGSTDWILDAATEAIDRVDPDLLWVYIPYLDYAGLRHGPGEELRTAVSTVDEHLGEFLDRLRARERWNETVVNVVSEYGFHDVDTPVFPNRVLRENGLLSTVDDGAGGENVDIPGSAAFAMVDHQVAHVYVEDDADARQPLESLGGVETVLEEAGKVEREIDHPNAGDLVLIAEPDAWFQYYWWHDHENAPAYATDMDIHAKPGFDPCELFVGEEGLVSLDPTKVGGSHGRVDAETFGVYGLGGPMAPETAVDDAIDARAVAPTITELLGITESIPTSFSHAPLVERDE